MQNFKTNNLLQIFNNKIVVILVNNTPILAPFLRPIQLKDLLCHTHGVAGSSPVQTA